MNFWQFLKAKISTQLYVLAMKSREQQCRSNKKVKSFLFLAIFKAWANFRPFSLFGSETMKIHYRWAIWEYKTKFNYNSNNTIKILIKKNRFILVCEVVNKRSCSKRRVYEERRLKTMDPSICSLVRSFVCSTHNFSSSISMFWLICAPHSSDNNYVFCARAA